MEPLILWALMALLTTVMAGLYLIFPRVSRRGLLFGVYVGGPASTGPEALRIAAAWRRALLLWLVASLAAGVGLGLAVHPGTGTPAAVLTLAAGAFLAYLRAYRRARALARDGAPLAAATLVTLEKAPSAVFAHVALGLSVAGGIFSLAYAGGHYRALPPSVPTHFDLWGRPDAWRPTSFASVMLLPLLTLVVGAGMAGFAELTARAKRAIRHPDGGVSLEAQTRFRGIMTGYLAVTALVVTALLTLLSVTSIQVALGQRQALPGAIDALSLMLLIVALGGSVLIALRYGQGGARLEEAAADAPLTNGLADNRHWVLGMFYVNRDDPSILVERRFGIGYTVNLGNPKAVALFVGFVVLVLGLALAPALIR